ncbi:portal protein [Microbacterium phage Lucky3]|uniref:Portal protein n=2 Tax=Kojivirus golden TaxID=2560590 RepID=A0A2P1CFR5_9CAUD|nr:portal protein [Microbacterium phage Golden]AVJ49751.1 portal protein [Microbacterium phage Golden]AVJ50060.1 portal protein [Microbacterium phage Lucky3]WNM67976.1 portal protein [Microbacterium phage SirVictor]WNM74347.1 portal protein [Microbacterium phage Guetzie]
MTDMTKLQTFLLNRDTPTFSAYYNGKMSYALHGKEWEKYVSEAFPNLKDQQTSENIFKAVIDLYAENLVPVPDELRGFSNILVPLLSRGEAPVVVLADGTVSFPEHYEIMSDGKFTVTAIFTRDLEQMTDNVTFVNSSGETHLYRKDVPADFAPADKQGYQFVEETHGNELFRFALDDKGFGASMAALQDRANHSILDQTVIAEMYARPFWYLLNVELPPTNPYLPSQPEGSPELKEQKTKGAGGRIFTTSSEGPFGQLTPPTISDMIAYHDSIIDKVSQSSGIPQHYFKPGQGTPPTGVALKVLSKRFNNKIARMREDLTPELERLAEHLGVEKTAEIKDAAGKPEKEYELWNTSDDLLQESMDAHGIALSQMGYPLGYIAEVVTPGVDLEDYEEDTDDDPTVDPSQLGEPTDMTAMGQPGLVATPGQVAAYGANPGQRAKGAVS